MIGIDSNPVAVGPLIINSFYISNSAINIKYWFSPYLNCKQKYNDKIDNNHIQLMTFQKEIHSLF